MIRYAYWNYGDFKKDRLLSECIDDAYWSGFAERLRSPTTQESEMTLEERRAEAIAKYREVSKELLHASDTDGGGEALQAAFEALAHEQGFVEGYVVMMGVETGDRDRSRNTARYAGLRECLAHHDEGCSGCLEGDTLRRIIEAN